MTIQQAASAFNAGNLRAASQLCHQVLANEPGNPEAMNLMGAISGVGGRHDLAAEWMRKAVEICPADPYYGRNYAMALLKLNRVDDARTVVSSALAHNPEDAESLLLLGVIDSRQGDLEAAIANLQKAISINPKSAIAHYNLAEIHRRQGDMEPAIEHLKKSIELNPRNAEAINNLAGVLLDRGDFIDSLRYLQQLLQLDPRSSQAYCNLSVALLAAGDVEQAVKCLQNALKLDPSLKDARSRLINMLVTRGSFDEAVAMLDQWQHDEPNDARQLATRARMYERRGDLEKARELFDQIESDARDLPVVRLTEATLLDVEGKPAEAVAIYESLLEEHATDSYEAIGVHFSLGQSYDAMGEYDKAFENYQRGNENRRRGFANSFEPESSIINRDAIIDAYTKAWSERRPDAGHQGSVPIFILGMPRSGTSLTEQIIGAHSRVHAAGELQTISTVIKDTHGGRPSQQATGFQIIESDDPSGHRSPVIPRDFEAETLESIGRQYTEQVLALRSGNEPRVSDKMPYNFLFAPLIQMAMPGAKIIHTRRNPIDTCLSCYFQNFSAGTEFAFDLDHLVVYYQNYLKTMETWRELGLEMLEIDYEELVANTEPMVRKILDYCDLPFEPQCLASHKNKRAVATASYQQVRKPIYTKSVARWKRYEKHIGPLIEAFDH